MSNITPYKYESIMILICILVILLSYCLYWIITNTKILLNKELFSNDNKRSKIIKIYKQAEPNDTPNDEDCYDPDDNCSKYPDI